MSNEQNNGGKNNMNSNAAMNFNGLDTMFDDMFNSSTKPVTNVSSVEQVPISKEEERELQNNGTENISAINVDTARNKLVNIEMELNNDFVERNELIHAMILAMVTNSNLLMLGKPGTAKSKLAYSLCNRIENGNYFQWMLNKTSDPSEILGPFSVKEMENDKFVRCTTGKLPEAHIAFIDECYKSNAPTLNALLTIMNEHIFYNDGKPVPVPMISMFAASNEPPEDESLLAMHDRFLFRIDVEYVHDASNKKRMFNNYIYERAGISNNMSFTTITVDELNLLQKESRRVSVPKMIINKFIALINGLQKNATIQISDRRANECFKIMQGSALINGRRKVGLDDFNALKYVLWEKKDDLNIITSEINKIVNPFDDDFDKYKKQYNEVRAKIDNASSPKDRNQLYFQFQNSLKSIISKMNKLIADAQTNGKDVSEYIAVRDEIVSYNASLVNSVLGGTIGGNMNGFDKGPRMNVDDEEEVYIPMDGSSNSEYPF